MTTRQQVEVALFKFLTRSVNLVGTVDTLNNIPVTPKDQPSTVTIESLVQQYASGYLSTEEFLQSVGV